MSMSRYPQNLLRRWGFLYRVGGQDPPPGVGSTAAPFHKRKFCILGHKKPPPRPGVALLLAICVPITYIALVPCLADHVKTAEWCHWENHDCSGWVPSNPPGGGLHSSAHFVYRACSPLGASRSIFCHHMRTHTTTQPRTRTPWWVFVMWPRCH